MGLLCNISIFDIPTIQSIQIARSSMMKSRIEISLFNPTYLYHLVLIVAGLPRRIGPGFESNISHNDRVALQDHYAILNFFYYY